MHEKLSATVRFTEFQIYVCGSQRVLGGPHFDFTLLKIIMKPDTGTLPLDALNNPQNLEPR